MKHTTKLLAMCFVATTMLFAACGKDDDEKKPAQREPGTELTGRSYEGNIVNSVEIYGVAINIDLAISIDFLSGTDAELFTDMAMEVPAMPSMNQNSHETEQYKYHFDGHTLTMAETWEGLDGEEAETYYYNADDDTFYIEVPDEYDEEVGLNLRELMGADKVVLHRVE